MLFRSPSQLVQDAQRHGVTVLPVDVTISAEECGLEPCADGAHAVRLGFNSVHGLSRSSALRIALARNTQVFDSMEDLSLRAELNQRDLKALADANALVTLAGHRRNAHWLASGLETRPRLLANAPIIETAPRLPMPTEGEDILADYASLGLTLGRHPLALLRPRLQRMKLVTAEELARLPNGTRTRAAGIVTCRQRPGTATGVVFVTLEDETGYVKIGRAHV